MKSYHNSPAYQSYLAAKEKAAEMREKDGSRSKASQKMDSKVTIQPCEDEIPDDTYWSAKQLAGARFQRNQRLLLEIFSETAVPDLRSVVTNTRMNVLKRQVQSLNMHQKKLEAELEQLEEKFRAKRKKIEDADENFHSTVKKLSECPVNDSKYEEMVSAASTDLLERYKTFQEEQQKLLEPPVPSQEQSPSHPDENEENDTPVFSTEPQTKDEEIKSPALTENEEAAKTELDQPPIGEENQVTSGEGSPSVEQAKDNTETESEN